MKGRARISRATLVAYGLPMAGYGCSHWIVSLYLLKYATDVLLIAPGVMGLIFGLSRVWDAVSDPIAGFLSDRTRSRWGRRRPWLLASIPCLALSLAALWAPPPALDGAALVAWMALAVVLFYTAETVFFVPHCSLGAELSPCHHERTRIFGSRVLFENLGVFAALGALFVLEQSADPRATARAAALAIGAAIALLTAAGTLPLRERTGHQGRAGGRAFRALGDVWRNPHARVLLGVFFVQELGMASLMMMLPFASQYVLGTPGRTAVYLVCFLLPLFVALPLWLQASRRWGKRRVWMAGNAASALAFGAVYFLGEGDGAAVMAIAACIGAANAGSRMVAPSVQADVVDYDELSTGERKEGSYFAAFQLVEKTAIGCALALMGWTLDLAGFVPGGGEQGEAAILAIRLLVSVVPLVFLAAAALLLMAFRFDEDAHRAVRRSLDQRVDSGLRSSPPAAAALQPAAGAR